MQREDVAIVVLSLLIATCLTIFMVRRDWPGGPAVQFLMPPAAVVHFNR
jgi:hypothetical protein